MQLLNSAACMNCDAERQLVDFKREVLVATNVARIDVVALCKPCLEKALALFPKDEKWGCFVNMSINGNKPWDSCAEEYCGTYLEGKTKETCGYWRKID